MRLVLLATAIAALLHPACGEWRVLEGFQARSSAVAGSRGVRAESAQQQDDAGSGTHIQALYAAARRLSEADELPTVEPDDDTGAAAAGDAGTEDTDTGDTTAGGGGAPPPDDGEDDTDTVETLPPVDTDGADVGGTNTTASAPAASADEPAVPDPVEPDITEPDPVVPDPVDEPDGVHLCRSCAGSDRVVPCMACTSTTCCHGVQGYLCPHSHQNLLFMYR